MCFSVVNVRDSLMSYSLDNIHCKVRRCSTVILEIFVQLKMYEVRKIFHNKVLTVRITRACHNCEHIKLKLVLSHTCMKTGFLLYFTPQ